MLPFFFDLSIVLFIKSEVKASPQNRYTTKTVNESHVLSILSKQCNPYITHAMQHKSTTRNSNNDMMIMITTCVQFRKPEILIFPSTQMNVRKHSIQLSHTYLAFKSNAHLLINSYPLIVTILLSLISVTFLVTLICFSVPVVVILSVSRIPEHKDKTLDLVLFTFYWRAGQ